MSSAIRLFPEMSSTVYFLPQETEAAQEIPERRIYCPSDAIMSESESGPSYVWLVDDEKRLRRVDMKAGVESNGRTEILEGLSGGEQAVIRPPAEVREGQLVKVVE